MIIVWFILGIFGTGFLVLLIYAARETMMSYRRRRHQWALAIGLPARIAANERLSDKTQLSSLNPLLDLELANTRKGRAILKERIMAESFGEVLVDDIMIPRAKERILARLTNQPKPLHLQRLDEPLNVLDLIAWDASMLVEETRIAATLGWIDQDEAWGLVFLNARRIQDTFESWEGFVASALRGRAQELMLYKRINETPAVSKAVREAFNDPSSVLEKLPWRNGIIFGHDDFVMKDIKSGSPPTYHQAQSA